MRSGTLFLICTKMLLGQQWTCYHRTFVHDVPSAWISILPGVSICSCFICICDDVFMCEIIWLNPVPRETSRLNACGVSTSPICFRCSTFSDPSYTLFSTFGMGLRLERHSRPLQGRKLTLPSLIIQAYFLFKVCKFILPFSSESTPNTATLRLWRAE